MARKPGAAVELEAPQTAITTFPVFFFGHPSVSDLAFLEQASSSALVALGNAVESAVSEEARVSTPTLDVFVRENLFPVAISSAKRRLEVAAREERGMVAWGNTNTQVRLSFRLSACVSLIKKIVLWKYFHSIRSTLARNACCYSMISCLSNS